MTIPKPCECEFRDMWDGHCLKYDGVDFPRNFGELQCYDETECTDPDCSQCGVPKRCPLLEGNK